jgi:hypothetical protein
MMAFRQKALSSRPRNDARGEEEESGKDRNRQLQLAGWQEENAAIAPLKAELADCE